MPASGSEPKVKCVVEALDAPHDAVAADCPKVKHRDLDGVVTHLRVRDVEATEQEIVLGQPGTRVDNGPITCSGKTYRWTKYTDRPLNLM